MVTSEEENVEVSTNEASEEVAYEGKREMEEVADNSAPAPSTSAIENPDRNNFPEPQDDPKDFLRGIAKDNAEAKRNEGAIQRCIKEDGCGTPQ